MASMQIAKPAFTSAPIPRSKFSGSSRWFKKLESKRRSFVSCKVQDGDGKSNGNGEEPPESLFVKELKRRGMTPASLLEDNKEELLQQRIRRRGGVSRKEMQSLLNQEIT